MNFMNYTCFMSKSTRPLAARPGSTPAQSHPGTSASTEQVIAELSAKVHELARRVQELESDKANFGPLAPALARGRAVIADELANPSNLTLEEAAQAAGRSDRTVNEERIKCQWYALLPDGKTRGYRYPQWQFDVPRDRLRPVLLALRDRELSPWAQHRFLTRPSLFLPDEAVPSQLIKDSAVPLDLVIRAIDARFAVDQGGS